MNNQTTESLALLFQAMGIQQPSESPSIKIILPEFLDAKLKAGRTRHYVDCLRQYLSHFATAFDRRIGEITCQHIESWFLMRNEAPRSRMTGLGRLSSLFNWAWRRGYILQNPCLRVEPVPVATRQPEILSIEQCAAMLRYTATTEPRYLAWLALALLGGMRPQSEADRLLWGDINLVKNRIRIEGQRTKTRRHRLIDGNISAALFDWLRLAREKGATLPLDRHRRRGYMRRLAAQIGTRLLPHDILRHTAASYLFAYHQDAGKVAAFLGNSAGILLRHYRALVDHEDGIAFRGLTPDAVLSQPSGECRSECAKIAEYNSTGTCAQNAQSHQPS